MNIKRILVIIAIFIIFLIIGYILFSKLAFSDWNDGVVSKSEEIIRTDLGDEFLFQYKTSNFPHLSTTVTIIDSKIKNEIAYFVVNGYFYKPELTTILNFPDIRCYEVYCIDLQS